MLSNIKPEWIIEIAPEIYSPINLIAKNNLATIELINNFNINNLQYLVKNKDNIKYFKKNNIKNIEKLIKN